MSFSDREWRRIHGTSDEDLDLADEYLAKAQRATDYETMFTNAQLALQYNPNCLEAESLMAFLKSRGNYQRYKEEMKKVLAHGEWLMEDEGYLPDMVGNFWGILETRPYMRMLNDYSDMLASKNDYEEAIKIAERMLELNPNDNQGVRWSLSHYYVMTLDRQGAEKLIKDFPDDSMSIFWMGLALLYFRLKEEEKVRECLGHVKRRNRGFDVFLDALGNPSRMNDLRKNKNPIGLAVGSVDELVYEYDTYDYAWKAAKNFERWLKKVGPTL